MSFPDFEYSNDAITCTHKAHSYPDGNSKQVCAANVQMKTRYMYVDGTPTSVVTPMTIRYIHPPHDNSHDYEWSLFSMSIGPPIPK